jgi:acetyl esterase/lipase
MNNAITILPSYRKMPEVHGKELFDDVDSFWQWYLSPQGRKELEEKTKVRFHNYEKPLVSGESAGGHLAVYSWWTQKKLKIAGIYLQYPMLRAYTRGLQDLGSGGQGQIYRGVSIPEDEIQQVARANFGFLVKEKGQIEPRVNSDPPLGMDMAFISSTSRVELDFDGKMVKWSFWKYWFQQPDIFDRLEAVLGLKTKQNIQGNTPFGTSGKVIFRNDKGEVEPEAAKEWPDYYCKAPDPDGPNYCPPFFISQGGEDKNCPDTDATEFKNLLSELYPKAKNDIELIIRPGQPHAWDYKVDMNSQDDKWLLDGLMRVTKSWSTGQPKVVEQTAFDTADDVVER